MDRWRDGLRARLKDFTCYAIVELRLLREGSGLIREDMLVLFTELGGTDQASNCIPFRIPRSLS